MVSHNFQGTYRLAICHCNVISGLDLLKITVGGSQCPWRTLVHWAQETPRGTFETWAGNTVCAPGEEYCTKVRAPWEWGLPALFSLGRDPGFYQSLKQADFVHLEGCYLSVMVWLCFCGRPKLRVLARLLVGILVLVVRWLLGSEVQ